MTHEIALVLLRSGQLSEQRYFELAAEHDWPEGAGGLSPIGAHLLGFNEMCRCGHEEGLHDSSGRCAVLDCGCEGFKGAKP